MKKSPFQLFILVAALIVFETAEKRGGTKRLGFGIISLPDIMVAKMRHRYGSIMVQKVQKGKGVQFDVIGWGVYKELK